jgi:hypothetical protein
MYLKLLRSVLIVVHNAVLSAEVMMLYRSAALLDTSKRSGVGIWVSNRNLGIGRDTQYDGVLIMDRDDFWYIGCIGDMATVLPL